MHITAFRLPLAILVFGGVALFFSDSAQAAAQNATAGQAVTFSVSADGTSPFSYQWYKNGVAISGARSASYTLSACATGDAGTYKVVVSNLAGSTTSDNAVLTVSLPQPSEVPSDFNWDGHPDIVWQNTSTGDRKIWLMNGLSLSSEVSLAAVSVAWQIVGIGDFNGDGQNDILWQNTVTGQRALWLMNGYQTTSVVDLGWVDTNWSIAGTGDFNGDGKTDILWQNTTTGQRALWLMNGVQNGFRPTSIVNLGWVDLNWSMVGTGDFNGDGMTDILWQNTTTGQRALWLMNGIQNGFQATSIVNLGWVDLNWSIAGTCDLNGDGMTDILWQNTTTGQRALWIMGGIQNGFQPTNIVNLGFVDLSWSIGG